MSIEVRPAVDFEDVRALVGPKRPDASVCWCLSYRIPSKLNNELRGPARGAYVARLLEQGPLGVIAYATTGTDEPDGTDGAAEEPVGWAAVAPRADTTFARNRRIPTVDDLPVWSVWCIRVRPGHRGRGVSHALISGAVDFARDHGAPALEAYPLDNRGARVDLTMAYPGLRRNFEAAGFRYVTDTTSVLSGHPRVLMRHDLGAAR
ncbi:GNAT family N-acetyltransferase [Nocardioides sp. SYSU DS0651]|uniref:GNAT family N-acetyltransferase n=1 Tax=Nocardioides sp. SYSU DS0651 TaxID=3415955 RepID=UPI003F4C843B